MTEPKWRVLTEDEERAEINGLIASRAQWQPGDCCEPMISGGREVVMVMERIEKDGFLPKFMCRRDDGTIVEVWVMDDPRPVDPGTPLG